MLTKPFSPRELVARVSWCFATDQGAPDAMPQLEVGDVRLGSGRATVFSGTEEVALTVTEFDLLAHLMRRPGRVVQPRAVAE